MKRPLSEGYGRTIEEFMGPDHDDGVSSLLHLYILRIHIEVRAYSVYNRNSLCMRLV